jgi:hypothetical protein
VLGCAVLSSVSSIMLLEVVVISSKLFRVKFQKKDYEKLKFSKEFDNHVIYFKFSAVRKLQLAKA